MLSTELEYICTQLECFLQGWNAFDSVGLPLYRVGMLSTGWECFLQGWNTFVQGWNDFYRVGILSTELE
jgi:ABC-type glycerol-3-phosphate transport system permease component